MGNTRLRIKEIAKEKGMTMADIARTIGITPINLSASLNGNPTLSRLAAVADILGVSVSDLFEVDDCLVQGYIEFAGHIYKVRDLGDLIKITEKIKTLMNSNG
jgi:transcriptional regulator with XRE-family HTH domain